MNKINIENEKKIKFDFDIDKLSKKIVKCVLELEKVYFDISVNISIVDNKVIKKYNKNFRDINKETDVLSFPNIDFDKPSNFRKLVNGNIIDVSIIDLNSKTIFLGDVVISYEKVITQAKLYEHSVKREFAFLLTHSMLHLLGYDHINVNDEKIMFKKQDVILDKLKIKR